jgi:hypothetical protein
MAWDEWRRLGRAGSALLLSSHFKCQIRNFSELLATSRYPLAPQEESRLSGPPVPHLGCPEHR